MSNLPSFAHWQFMSAILLTGSLPVSVLIPGSSVTLPLELLEISTPDDCEPSRLLGGYRM